MALTKEELRKKLAKDAEYMAYKDPKAEALDKKDAGTTYDGNIEAQRDANMKESNAVYDNAIKEANKMYDSQLAAVNQWQTDQEKLQQERTDFTIKQIEQQKAQAGEDYEREQKGAYTDYKKESNQYGVNAEQRASRGMSGTGYAESSQVSIYNQYQNRVAIARESYAKIVQDYNNGMTEARLQNNSALAEIAYSALQYKLSIAVQSFQTNNSLLIEKMNQKNAIDDRYYSRYRDTVSDKQYNEQLKYQQGRDAVEDARYNEQLKYQQGRDVIEDARYNEQLKYQQGRDAVEDNRWNKEYNLALSESFNDASVDAPPIQGDNGKWTSETSYVTDTHASTLYWYGEKNKDGTEFGYFDNGYQPKGIKDYGKVTKSYDENGKNDTITFNTQTLDGQAVTVTQNIWKTKDGTKWVWDGRENRYIPLEKFISKMSSRYKETPTLIQ